MVRYCKVFSVLYEPFESWGLIEEITTITFQLEIINAKYRSPLRYHYKPLHKQDLDLDFALGTF